jgi:hypothetical protein
MEERSLLNLITIPGRICVAAIMLVYEAPDSEDWAVRAK